MAQTTRLWPRRMSPAAKTPGRFVANLPCSALALVRGVLLDAELVEQLALRPEEAHRQQHELRREDLLRAGNFARDRTGRCP